MSAFLSTQYPEDDAVISNIEYAGTRRRKPQRHHPHDNDDDRNDDNNDNDDASTVPYNPDEEQDNNNSNNNNDNLQKDDNTCHYRRVARKRKAVVVVNNNNNNNRSTLATDSWKKQKKKTTPPSQHAAALLIPPPRQASAYHGSLGAVIDGVMLHFDDDLFVFLEHLSAAIHDDDDNDRSTFTITTYAEQYDLPRTTTGRLSRALRQGGRNQLDADLGKQWQVILQAFWEWQAQGGHDNDDDDDDDDDDDGDAQQQSVLLEQDIDENGENDNNNNKDFRFLDNTPTTAKSALDKYIWRQFDGDCFAFLRHLCEAMHKDSSSATDQKSAASSASSSPSFSVADYCRQYGLPVHRSTLHRLVAMVRGEGRDPCLGKLWWTRWQQFQLATQQVEQQQQQQVVAAQFSESKSRQASALRRAAARQQEQEQGEIIPLPPPPPRMDTERSKNNDNDNPAKEPSPAAALVTPPTNMHRANNLRQRRSQRMEPSQLYPPLIDVEQEQPNPNATPNYLLNDDGDDDQNGMLVSWKVAVGMGILAFFAVWGPVALLLTLHNRWVASSSLPPPPPGFLLELK